MNKDSRINHNRSRGGFVRTCQKQRIIIGTLCVVIISLAVGYAVLSQQLNIQGSGSVISNFQILFTKIEEGTMNGATTIQKEIVGDTTASFIIDLKAPGSSGEYIITVENRGNIDAYVKDIKGVVDSNKKEPKDIQFSIDGLKVNDKLKARETKTFKVKVNWDSNSTSIPETSKDLSLTIDFAQDTNQITSGGNITEFVQDLLETSSDGTYEYMGGTYLKGNQDSNYIWFDGFLWRIMGINEDGSIRMITEEMITVIPWGAENTALDYDNSYVNDWLNNYFYSKLKDKDLLVNQTWCSETTTDSNSRRTTCANNLSKVQKPIGLLSLDEYNLVNSTSSYIYNLQSVWTSTPYNTSNEWGVGRVINDSNNNYSVINTRGVRPIINVLFNITIVGGNGTLTDPYIIEETNNITGSLKDNSRVGEYVMYAGRNYRVVETSNHGTKLILDGYYDSNNDGVIEESDKMSYGTNCTLCTTINEDSFINWISNNNETDKNKLVRTTWYRGDYWTDYNYKTNLESIGNSYDGKVGLIRIGEVLSGYSPTIPRYSSQIYWSSTPYNNIFSWQIAEYGHLGANSISTMGKIRPVIMISPDVQITSGNGTFNEPFQI